MSINKEKTTVMVISKEQQIKINIGGTEIERVNTFKYLGTEIGNQLKCRTEVNATI